MFGLLRPGSAASARRGALGTRSIRTKSLHRPGDALPYSPPVDIRLGPTYQSRLRTHYENTLADDLMYMHYIHHSSTYTEPKQRSLPQHDPEDPYAVNRPMAPPRGGKVLTPLAPPTTPDNVTRLERISLHTMVKSALTSRSHLFPPIMALRQLSGETKGGGGHHTSEGVKIIRGRKSLPSWKLRPGLPVAATVDIKGDKMYEFLGTFVEFVLPRLREFPGVIMPAPSANPNSPSATSGVVSFGFPKTALELFPQIEVNLDQYPSLSGFYIHLVTNAKGKNAQNRARALISGFQVPFIRK